jgi:hypothetical protein
LRHPLLALDALRALTKEYAIVESATCDAASPALADKPIALFYRRDELNADPSNWFVPSSRALVDWCESAGFSVVHSADTGVENRSLVGLSPTEGDPEYFVGTYERPLEVVARQRFA